LQKVLPDEQRNLAAGNKTVISQKTKPETPQFLKLGEAYLKQKEKLNEELKHDYREALAEV